jgi:hypothetical protein
MYSHGRAKIYNLLNGLLHEFLGLTPAINLTIFFYKVNIFLLFLHTFVWNEMVGWLFMVNWKNMGGINCGILQSTILAFIWKDWGKLHNSQENQYAGEDLN